MDEDRKSRFVVTRGLTVEKKRDREARAAAEQPTQDVVPPRK